MDTDSINIDIGRRIRNHRNRNGLTQQELADRTELTKGFISQLERGQVSASVVTLMDLIECLGTTPAEFFKDEEEQVVFTEKEYFEKLDEQGNSRQWIVPTAQRFQMEPLLVRLSDERKAESVARRQGVSHQVRRELLLSGVAEAPDRESGQQAGQVSLDQHSARVLIKQHPGADNYNLEQT